MATNRIPLSVLDLAFVRPGMDVGEAFSTSVALARLAEEKGYRRVWYAEHHNMPSIASSATSVLMAHVAAQTSTIRIGSGGIMLPNHAPLTIAEQFGTLATLHPGRIDLGLGRAPGTDQQTLRALRREPGAAERFPQDVLELAGYLYGPTRISGVEATPGKGTEVPLYILGSSLFGASLAAELGLPYANASHFAPDSLVDAVALYRDRFKPSSFLAEPYAMAAINAIAAPTSELATQRAEQARRNRVAQMLGRGRQFTEAQIDEIMTSPAAAQVLQMMRYTAVGTGEAVAGAIDQFAADANVDEVIVVSPAPDAGSVLETIGLLADAAQLPALTSVPPATS